MFEKWLSRIAFVHEGFSAFKGERREEDRRSTNRDKRFSKTSNFSASSNVKETKQTQSDHCPLADGTQKIWNCPLFKNMSVNDRYAAVRKQRLCYGCLGEGHAIKVNACGINGCIKKHNRLLHSENQMNEGNHAVNVSAATINQSNEVTSFLQFLSQYRALANGWAHMLSSIVDQRFHSSIKMCKRNYEPKAPIWRST